MYNWGGMDLKKIVVCFLALFLIFCVYLTGRGLNDSFILKNCFDLSGAEFMRMDIEGSGKIQTEDIPYKAASKLLNASGMGGAYEITEENGLTVLRIKNGRNQVVIKTRKMQGENLVYASVMYSQYSDNVNITNIRRSISKAFRIYNIKPSFSSLIQGKYNEALTIPQMKARAASVFSSGNARFVEGVDDGNMVSVSGYIAGLKDVTKCMGKMVNLNTALRYSRVDGCTYIWVGSPIILLEY